MNSSFRDFENTVKSRLSERRDQGLFRERRTVRPISALEFEMDGRTLVNFGSNDYLSLTNHPKLRQAAIDAASLWPSGAGASPLISGRGPWMEELEGNIAAFEDAESALVFGSGYAANVATIAAIANHKDVIFSDALNHASLIDGCRLSRARVHIYRHCDMDDLISKLHERRADGENAFIVTDAVFSMDGDVAPLDSIVEIAMQFDAQIVIDEAHATGVLGERGRGLAEHMGIMNSVRVRIGTLSKAVGSIGGFVTGPKYLTDYLVNFARNYIFSTAMPPSSALTASAGIKLISGMADDRVRLKEMSQLIRARLMEAGWNVPSGFTPIIPVYLGQPDKATVLSKQLLELGLFVPAIRPPTVPQGQSMLRISINASHQPGHIDKLVSALRTSH